MPVQTRIQLRRDTAANWTSVNPTLAAGEIGIESDTRKFKFGNGSTAWNSLPYGGGDILDADLIGFDTTPETSLSAAGQIGWDGDSGTLQIRLAGNNVTLQVGQEENIYARNAQNATISDGQVVYVSGSNGQKLNVKLAKADSLTTSRATVGVVTETILNTNQGFVTTRGLIHDLNTNAWNEGDSLYLSGTTAGALTNVPPTAGMHVVRVGYVVTKSSTVGVIYVDVQHGAGLDDADDVVITSPTDGQALTYEASTGLWKNKTVSGESFHPFLLMGA
jgi:hypothetical protein